MGLPKRSPQGDSSRSMNRAMSASVASESIPSASKALRQSASRRTPSESSSVVSAALKDRAASRASAGHLPPAASAMASSGSQESAARSLSSGGMKGLLAPPAGGACGRGSSGRPPCQAARRCRPAPWGSRRRTHAASSWSPHRRSAAPWCRAGGRPSPSVRCESSPEIDRQRQATGRRQATAGSPLCLLGLMFWFSRNRLSGSYLSFSAVSRSYFRSPKASRTRSASTVKFR